jgi:hypothetical protein
MQLTTIQKLLISDEGLDKRILTDLPRCVELGRAVLPGVLAIRSKATEQDFSSLLSILGKQIRCSLLQIPEQFAAGWTNLGGVGTTLGHVKGQEAWLCY